MKFTNKNQNIQKPSQNHSKISATLQLISSEWKILFPHGPLMRGLSTNHHQQECWTISEWSADVKHVWYCWGYHEDKNLRQGFPLCVMKYTNRQPKMKQSLS